MYFSEKEKNIIREFYSNLKAYDKEEMELLWKDGSSVIAEFDTCFDDDNESELEDNNELELYDEKYEEFVSFIFKVVEVTGNPPVYITEDKYFCVDYRNFPDEILVGDKKIN